MINLLPLGDRVEIKKEYLRRLAVVSGIFLSLSILVFIIILLPALLLAKNQKHNYERQLFLSQQQLVLSGAAGAILAAEDLNSKLEIFGKGQKEAGEISGIIAVIIGNKTDGIKLDAFLYDKGKIIVRGESETRKELLSFIEALKRERQFTEVESPASNLLKEKDIEFNILIGLAKNNEK